MEENRRIFLDVGAWRGETVKAVLSSNHKFDKIYCFEPQLDKCQMIKNKKYENVEVCEFGLFNETCVKSLFIENNSDGASIYPDKVKKLNREIKVPMVKASDWFKDNIKVEDYVVLKMNCEGSECDILDDLIDSGEFNKVSALMVDLDVRKVPSQAYREEEMKEKLKKYDIPILTVEGKDRTDWSRKHVEWTHYWMNKIIK